MKRYAEKFNELEEKYKTLHNALFILAQNIRADQPGGMSATTQYSKMLGVVYKSASYRAHSVIWHINELCNYHVHYESQYLLDIKKKDDTSEYYKMYLSYTFDDFIFNLMSLYDYFARYFYIAFVSELKAKKTWRSLAKLCEDQKNEFYNCNLAEMIRNHNRMWVQKIEDFRANIIHYEIKMGDSKAFYTWKDKEGYAAKIMCAMPDDIVKKLQLQDCPKNNAGIDLQFGTIEIGKKTFESLCELTELANNTCTSKFYQKDTFLGTTPQN